MLGIKVGCKGKVQKFLQLTTLRVRPNIPLHTASFWLYLIVATAPYKSAALNTELKNTSRSPKERSGLSPFNFNQRLLNLWSVRRTFEVFFLECNSKELTTEHLSQRIIRRVDHIFQPVKFTFPLRKLQSDTISVCQDDILHSNPKELLRALTMNPPRCIKSEQQCSENADCLQRWY